MKVLIDMNMSPRLATVLGSAGIEAVHWSEVGPAGAADAQLMKFASAHGYVVLTNDLDFGAILAATQGAKPFVVQVRADDLRPEAIAHPLLPRYCRRRRSLRLERWSPLMPAGRGLGCCPSHRARVSGLRCFSPAC